MLPLYLFANYILWVVLAILAAKFGLICCNYIYKPKEGYFPRSNISVDYRFWSLRATIKKFAFWAAHNFPLPWIDILAFKLFGVKSGWTTPLFDAWVDTEFLEIGENSIIGQGSVVMSTMVTKDWLIIKKVKIGNNVIIGAHSVVSPGTIIEDNCVLGALAGTSVGQKLEEGWVYMGVPCRKYKKNEYKSEEESEEELARKRELFKQYLTLEDIERIEQEEFQKSWKERRAEKKQEKEKERIEKEKEREQKRLEKEKEREQKRIDKEIRKVEREKERIEKEKEKDIEKQEKEKEKDIEKQELEIEKLEKDLSAETREKEILEELIKYHEQEIAELKEKREDINLKLQEMKNELENN